MKDLDTAGGKVAAYFATFDDIDKHGRKMDENAFRRSIKNNSTKWFHLFNHNTSAIIGKVLEAGTDDKGAFFVSKLLPTSLGQDVLTMYEEGILNEHSFGFEIVHSIQMNSYELVKEARVHEVSSVTFAANPAATTISVNSIMDWMEQHDKSSEALEKINYLTSQLNPDALENSLKSFEDRLNDSQLFSGNNYSDAVKKLDYLASKFDPEGIQNSLSRLSDTQMQEQILKKLEQISNLLAGGEANKQDEADGASDIIQFIENY
jgi:HK97 family phage prohead protease